MTEAKTFQNYFDSKIVSSIENYGSPRGSKNVEIKRKSKIVN